MEERHGGVSVMPEAHARGEIEAVEAIGAWCARAGLGPVAGRVAAALMAHAGPLDEGEVARCAGVSRDEARTVLDALVEMRLAQRLPDTRVAWDDDGWGHRLVTAAPRARTLRAMLETLRPQCADVLARRIEDALAFARFMEDEGPGLATRWDRASGAAARAAACACPTQAGEGE
ncbi:MAG: hypothetical protein RLZZ299_2987 [Pseudomonadota bacterium]|jgi:hypothetical protein